MAALPRARGGKRHHRSTEGPELSRGMAARSRLLIQAAHEILEEMQPASVRAVCYRLFIAGLIPNMGKSATNSVSRFLRIAREEGSIPWEWITDESREAEVANRWASPEHIIQTAVASYRRDYWQDQPYRVEVWSEKGTIRGTLAPVLKEYGVTFRVMHGYASATVVNDVAGGSGQKDKSLFALYVGDWDPSGKHMSDVDLPRRISLYGGYVAVQRIALREYHLLGLPSFDPETKAKDPRFRWFRENVGTQCYELDAISPNELRGCVADHIRSYLDVERWEMAKSVEAVEMESMQQFHNSWLATISSRG